MRAGSIWITAGQDMSRDTRTRILVASLLLFNERGVPGTTTNEIADEVDISPGNLHYHFRRKSDIVAALLTEFQADARRVLVPAGDEATSLDDFWLFLHLLLELKAAYSFLFRDTESLVVDYPKVADAVRHFARGLTAAFELQLRALSMSGVISIDPNETALMGRNLAVIALFSERLDVLVDSPKDAENAALRVAAAVLNALKPHAEKSQRAHLEELAARYEPG